MSRPPLDAKEIFIAAIDCASPEALQAYLAAACGGSPDVQQEVERLLRAYEKAGNFLGGSASYEATANMPASTPLPFAKIGPYKLLQQIGEGGMGTVFMAEQSVPIQRKVALKLIKPGLDSRQTAARFEAERQALALMDHPNIAKVLDAGTTESGQPYFVMELVHGVPITRYCDQHRLSPRERLQLFIPVCQAVQHAHQKGLIHRDLKPSNVLVAMYDGKPVPKVIDFGVAKALGQKLTDKTMFTEFGSIVGTLEYMSPEQAEQSQLDVDTRSDIYSLGVILYELLTGTTPLDRKRLKDAAILELLRIIKDEEPQKPSTRLSTTLALPSIAANRGLEPKKLSGLMRGELDWIVMKAIEKDRNRRYETANGFAADVQRYLLDEPVAACPPSASYRFRKFARRNKGLLAGVSSVVAVLIAGTVVSTLLALRAMDAESLSEQRLEAETRARKGEFDARQVAEKERDRAIAAEKRAASERDRAEVGFAQARSTVNTYLTQVSENQLLTAPGLQPLRRELLQSALKFYQDFLTQRGDDPTVRAELAAAEFRICEVYRELGLYDEAGKANARSQRLYETLLETDPDNPDLKYSLAKCADAAHDWAKAIEILEPLVITHPERDDIQRTLADTYNSLGRSRGNGNDTVEQFRLYQLALAIRERLVTRNPNNLEDIASLGTVLNNLGTILYNHDPAASCELYRRAVEQKEIVYSRAPQLVQNGRGLAVVYNNLAMGKERLGRIQEANVSFQRALDVLRQLSVENPAVPYVQAEFAASITAQANRQRKQGKLDDANRSLLQVQQVISRLPRESALDLYNLSCFHAVYAEALVDERNQPTADVRREAQQEADLAVESLQQAVDSGFNDAVLLTTDKDLDSLRQRDDFTAIVEQVRQSVTIAELSKSTSGQTPADQLSSQQRVLDIRREQAEKDPGNLRTRSDLALNHHSIGLIQIELQQFEPAATSLAEAHRLRSELVREDPENFQYQFDLSATLGAQANVAESTGQTELALDRWDQQLQLLETVLTRQPRDVPSLIALGHAWYARGDSLWNAKRFDNAIRCWDEGFQVLHRGHQELPDETELTRALASQEFELAQRFGEQGYFELAAQHWTNSTTLERYLGLVWEARYSIVAAWNNQKQEFDETCRLLADKYADEDPAHVAWACTFRPDCSVPPGRILEIAEEAARRDPKGERTLALRVLALAHFRNGNFEQARGKVGEYLEAVIEWRSGEQETARKLLHAAELNYSAVAERTLSGMQDKTYQPVFGHRFWWEELATRLARQEAWQLIEGRVPLQSSQLLIDSLLWSRLGNQTEADKALREALAETPQNPQSLAKIATSLSTLGHPEWALAAYATAIERDPESVELWLARAHFHVEQGKFSEAENDFVKAASLTPNELNKYIEAGWWVSIYPPNPDGWIQPSVDEPNETLEPASIEEPLDTARQWRAVQPLNPEGEIRMWKAPEFAGVHTAYAVTYVYSQDPQAVMFMIGGYAPVEMHLNGREIYRWKSYTTHYNLERVPVLLRPGRNTLVIRYLGPNKNTTVIFRIGDTALDRGFELAQLGLWDEGISLLKNEFIQGYKLKPQSWSYYSGLLAVTDDFASYHEFGHKVLDWIGDKPNSDTALHGSNAYSMAPIPDAVALRLVDIVNDGVAKSTSTGWPADMKPRLYFRAGRYQETLDMIGTRAGTGWTPLRALCHFYLGDADKAKQELVRAERYFLDIVRMKDNDPSSAGVIRYRSGLVGTAHHYVMLHEARRLISPDSTPDDSALHALQNAVREQLKAADPRLIPFEMALIYDGQNPFAWLARGRARAELGEWDLAEEDFSKAVAMAPGNMEVLAARGRMYADLNHIEEAVGDLTSVLRGTTDSSPAEIRDLIQRMCIEIVSAPELLEQLTIALPDDRRLWIGRARHFAVRQAWKEAAADYARVAETSIDPNEWIECAAAQILADDTANYERIVRSMIQRHATSSDTNMIAALVLACGLDANPPAGATQLSNWSEIAAKADPKLGDFQQALAKYRLGRFEDALALLTSTTKSESTISSAAKVLNSLLIALIHHRLGHADDARYVFKQSLADIKQLETGIADFRGGTPAEWLLLMALRREAQSPTHPIPVALPWDSLFDGGDLSAWRSADAQHQWLVIEGILTSGGAPNLLFSQRSVYADFHLRAEVRINSTGNSGILLRANQDPAATHQGYEVQICTDLKGQPKTGSLYKVFGWVCVARVDPSPVPANTWFTLEIIAQGPRIIVKINDRQTAVYTNLQYERKMGHIALQQQSADTKVEFRKIEIRELDAPTTSPPPAEPLPSTAVTPQAESSK